MRAQLSLEFLVYVAISAASLTAMLALFLRAQGAQGGASARAYAEELVALINANMEYSSSWFSAYLPAGLCNAIASNHTLSTGLGDFTLAGRLYIQSNTLCTAAGGIERFNVTELGNGTFALYR